MHAFSHLLHPRRRDAPLFSQRRSLSPSLPLLCGAAHCSQRRTDIKSETYRAKRLLGVETQRSDFTRPDGGIPEPSCLDLSGIAPKKKKNSVSARYSSSWRWSGHTRTLVTGPQCDATRARASREGCKSCRPQRESFPCHPPLFSSYDDVGNTTRTPSSGLISLTPARLGAISCSSSSASSEAADSLVMGL